MLGCMIDNPQNIPRTYIAEWQDKHARLSRQPRYRGKLADVFLSSAEDEYWADGVARVLYVGKATAGPYSPHISQNLYRGCNHSAFWTLARNIGKELNPDMHDGLDAVAWSNLLKIGVISGNPKGKLVEDQYELAVKTLKAEIKHFNPALLVCVAANYLDDILYEALELKRGSDGFIEEPVGSRYLYSRERTEALPAVLWLEHPERKRKEYVVAVLQRASSLVKSDLLPLSR